MRILVCTPFYQDFAPAKATWQALQNVNGYQFGIETRQGTYIHELRNSLVRTAIEENYDYVLFLDADVTGTPDDILTLLHHDKDIVSGCYRKHRTDRALAYDPELMPFGLTGLQEVDAVGMGFCMVKRRVFEKIGPPWFYNPKEGENVVGEDINFCRMAREKRFSVWCDFDVKVDHIERKHESFDWSKF